MKRNMIGDKLKSLREEIGYSQAELACLLGINQTTIEEWETGQIEPTLSEGLLLSRLYGIDLNDMFVDFDEIELLPEDRVVLFQNEMRRNRCAKRWYN